MIQNKTIVITGTHHTPAIELIRILRQDKETNWHIYYIGHQYNTESHIIHTIIPKLQIQFFNLDCGKFDRRNITRTILGIPKTFLAFFKALKLLHEIKPNIVVSFGGYVSVPVIVAAYANHIPSITHEQTLTISLSTRINSLFANKTAVSFPNDKYYYTGNLLRHEIYRSTSGHFSEVPTPFLLFIGGNQGSSFMNQLVYQTLPELLSRYAVVHQTGKNVDKDIQNSLLSKYNNYFPVEFIESEDIGWAINKSKIIISRSGANICQEINEVKNNAILVPLPFTQQNEQEKNAQWLKTNNPNNTIVINQDQASPNKIIDSINKLAALAVPPRIVKPRSNHLFIKLINDLVK